MVYRILWLLWGPERLPPLRYQGRSHFCPLVAIQNLLLGILSGHMLIFRLRYQNLRFRHFKHFNKLGLSSAKLSKAQASYHQLQASYQLAGSQLPTSYLPTGSQLKLCRTSKLLFRVQGVRCMVGVWWFATVVIIRLSQPPAGD